MPGKIIYLRLFLGLNLILCCLPGCLFGQMPWSQISGLDHYLQEEYKMLSPVPGMTFSTRNINYYRVGEKTPKVVLIRDLFNEIDEDNVLPTSLCSKVAAHLGPSLVGKLSGRLLHYRIGEDHVHFNERMIACSYSREKCTKEETASLANMVGKAKEDLARIIGKDSEFLNSVQECKKNYESLQKSKFNPKNVLSDKSIDDFADKLVSSFLETSRDKTDNTFKILNHYLWMKVRRKDEYLGYFSGIKEGLKLTEKTEEKVFHPSYADWSSRRPFDSSDLVDLGKTDNMDDFERTVFTLGRSLDERRMELHKKVDVTVPGGKFPNCGENTLLNLINLLLYDKDKRNFDVSILENLKKEGLKVDPRLIQYYYKYNTIDSQKHVDEKAGMNPIQDWTHLVSDLNSGDHGKDSDYFIKYLSKWDGKEYEIGPGMSNIFGEMGKLIGTSDLDKLGQSLRKMGKEMTFRKNVDPENDFGTIHIDTGLSTYLLLATPDHFLLTNGNEDPTSGNDRTLALQSSPQLMKTANNFWDHYLKVGEKDDPRALDYLSFVPWFDQETEKIFVAHDREPHFQRDLIELMFSNPEFMNSDMTLRLLHGVLKHESDPTKKDLLRKIMSKTIGSERFSIFGKEDFWLDYVLDGSKEDLYFLFSQDIINSMSDELRNKVFLKILEKKEKKLYKLINLKNLQNMKRIFPIFFKTMLGTGHSSYKELFPLLMEESIMEKFPYPYLLQLGQLVTQNKIKPLYPWSEKFLKKVLQDSKVGETLKVMKVGEMKSDFCQ